MPLKLKTEKRFGTMARWHVSIQCFSEQDIMALTAISI
jgi:hypothetical protein